MKLLWKKKKCLIKNDSCCKLLFSLLVDLSQQQIIKMSLEPQLEAELFYNNYALRPGRSQHDALECLYSSLSDKTKFIANINLSRPLSKLNKNNFLNKINTHPIILQAISRWIDCGVVNEYLSQASSFNQHIFETPIGPILAPLIINIVLSDLQINLDKQLMKQLKNKCNYHIVFYGFHCIVVSVSKTILNDSICILQNWLSNNQSKLEKTDLDVKYFKDGFNFLNYQITFLKSTNDRQKVKFSPSNQSIQLFNQGNRDVIQVLKSGPIKKLIRHLRPRLLNWGSAYAQYNSRQSFLYIDKVLFSQLRAAVIRRHPGKSRYWINQKYFPSNRTYSFAKKYYKASWILTDTNCIKHDFLPKLQWITKRHYIKVIDTKSIYDEDSFYWSHRL